MRRKWLQVRLGDSEHAFLAEEARMRGIKVSEHVRGLIMGNVRGVGQKVGKVSGLEGQAEVPTLTVLDGSGQNVGDITIGKECVKCRRMISNWCRNAKGEILCQECAR